MKKILLAIIISLCMVMPVMAMGPLMVSSHQLAWDREANGTGYTVAGYYIYYRVPPSTTWVNSQRSVQIPQPAVGVVPGYDALTLNLPNGSYEWCATAIDTNGNESGPSNIVPLALAIPASPANLKKQ